MDKIHSSSSCAVRRGGENCSWTRSVPEELLSYACVLIAERFYSQRKYLVWLETTIPYFVQKTLFFAKDVPMGLSVRRIEAGDIHPYLTIQGHQYHGEG